jgi:serine protease
MKLTLHLSKLTIACFLASASTVSQSAMPSDPLFHKAQNDYDYQWGLHALKFPQAWDIVRGHAYVAVLDGGIDTTHPDLQENFRPHLSYDFYNMRQDVDEMSPYRTGEIMDSVGHGTHVAGILAATTNNGIGGAGACWHCSLMIGKISSPHHMNTDYFKGYKPNYEITSGTTALQAAVDTGAQVVSMSFGVSKVSCSSSSTYTQFCSAIQHAAEMDAVLVAAAGNKSGDYMQFPANMSRVIAAHAVKKNLLPTSWTPTPYSRDLELGAPGVDIVSTFYPNIDYIPKSVEDNTAPPNKCRDSLIAPPGYGPCDGSSMASPYIAGMAALVRSANPLLWSFQVRKILTDSATIQSGRFLPKQGKGVPDALKSVKAALGQAKRMPLANRLTPLFSLYSEAGGDHFYTVSPQMAMAAIHEKLQPQPEGGTIHWRSEGGSATPGYANFPRWSNNAYQQPRAAVYIFTTHRNPYDANPNDNKNELAPLYRLSYHGDYTGHNPRNVDHVYSTEQWEVDAFKRAGYKLDGIEGYIYPRSIGSQPPGTIKLYRRYSTAQDDHAIFPETMLSEMISAGYSRIDGRDWIGYVYLNQDSDKDDLIDGFERIIGTDLSKPDTDDDGISDGQEIFSFPYSDPLEKESGNLMLSTS